MKINGTPQEGKHKALGGKKLAKPVPVAGAGGKGRSGCAPALLVFALLGGGWAHMIATSAGWVS